MRLSISFLRKIPVTSALWFLSLLIIGRTLIRPLSDPDLWWHLASGRYMVENQKLLNFEAFSFTLSGIPWINFEWITEMVYYSIVNLFGFLGFSIFCHVFFVAILSLFYLCLSQNRVPPLFKLCLFWIGFELLTYRFDARAGLISLFLLPLFVYLVGKMETHQKQTGKYFPLLFFLLTILWINSHAGVLYGVGLLFAFALGARWGKKR